MTEKQKQQAFMSRDDTFTWKEMEAPFPADLPGVYPTPRPLTPRDPKLDKLCSKRMDV